MSSVQLRISTVQGDTIVALPAELDTANAPSVGDGLVALLNSGVPSLIMDLTATSFWDCAGVRAVVRAGRRADALCTPACVALPAGGPVHRLADLTRLASRAPVTTGVAAAHRHLLAARPLRDGR
jgi:anti-anti-sigma factor